MKKETPRDLLDKGSHLFVDSWAVGRNGDNFWYMKFKTGKFEHTYVLPNDIAEEVIKKLFKELS